MAAIGRLKQGISKDADEEDIRKHVQRIRHGNLRDTGETRVEVIGSLVDVVRAQDVGDEY
jgi:hypothetical protein